MSRRASTLLYSCVVYFGFGIITAAIGPLLPDLAKSNGTGLAEIGLVFTGLFLGAVLSQFVAGPIADRAGRKPVFLFGVVLMVAATVGLTASRVPALTLAFALLWGIGLGATELAANVLIAELFAERSVSALNLLNVFYGLGAFAGPALVSLSWERWHTGMPALWVGAVVLVSQIPVVVRLAEDRAAGLSAAGRTSGEIPAVGAAGVGDVGRGRAVYRSPFLWVLGAALLVYVGTEQMVGGWATVYMTRTTAIAISSAALVASGFWIAFTLGRIAAAAVGARLAPRVVLAASLAEAAAGILLVNLGTGNIGLSIAGFLLTGFGFGPIYPTAIAIIGRFFAGATGKAIGTAGALGSVGGMVLPFLDGVFIARLGPAAGAHFAIFAVLGIVVLSALARLASGRPATPEHAATPPRAKKGEITAY